MESIMDDEAIIALFFARDERAIGEAAVKYGRYCFSIANNIIANQEDAEECVSETWWKSWNAIPPHKPNILKLFFGKITRNLAINIYNKNHAEKRGGNEMDLVLEELAECVSGTETIESVLQRQELIQGLNDFMAELPSDKRKLFLQRYWYGKKVADIAEQYELTENNVSVQLNRMRSKLKVFLTERGIDL